jgi:hypothetical protein
LSSGSASGRTVIKLVMAFNPGGDLLAEADRLERGIVCWAAASGSNVVGRCAGSRGLCEPGAQLGDDLSFAQVDGAREVGAVSERVFVRERAPAAGLAVVPASSSQ